MPGGGGNGRGSFDSVGYQGYWWSAAVAENDENSATYRVMEYRNDKAERESTGKENLLSVRCVRN